MMKIYFKIAIILFPIITVSIICLQTVLSGYAMAQEKKFNFVAVGDLDCNINSMQTVNNILDKKPQIFLALGDMYYDCNPDEFMKVFSLLNGILYMTMGNHDSWSKFAGLYHLPNDKPYYSFDKGNVHFYRLALNQIFDKTLHNTIL